MKKKNVLVAKNPSEARGIRKALNAAGLKFEFKSSRKANPKKRRTKKIRRSKARRRK